MFAGEEALLFDMVFFLFLSGKGRRHGQTAGMENAQLGGAAKRANDVSDRGQGQAGELENEEHLLEISEARWVGRLGSYLRRNRGFARSVPRVRAVTMFCSSARLGFDSSTPPCRPPRRTPRA